MIALFARLILWAAVLIGSLYLFVGGGAQQVQDWWFLRNYHPTAQVQQLADEIHFTGKGRLLFYRADPQIVDRATLESHCPQIQRGVEIVGCFDNQHVYVLQIANPQLMTQMGTAAAHETLHFIYQRLSKQTKDQLASQLESQVSTCEQKTPGIDLKGRLQDYAVSEPGEQDNELHSILGTECQGLATELESYYGQYFADRGALVALSAKYNEVFLTAKRSIENARAGYLNCSSALKSEESQIGRMEAQMTQLRSSGDSAGYNALVGPHNRLVDQYNGQRQTCISLQNQYNSAVDGYNALISQ